MKILFRLENFKTAIFLIFLLTINLVTAQPLDHALNRDISSEEITPSLIRELILAVLKLIANSERNERIISVAMKENGEPFEDYIEMPINGYGRRFLGRYLNNWYTIHPVYPRWYPNYY